jgi:carbonic anhydrase
MLNILDSTSNKPGLLWSYTDSNDCAAVVSVASKSFSLLQFHLHHPSEHQLNGVAFDGEVHFVHQHTDGTLLVLGVFLTASGTTDNGSSVAHYTHFVYETCLISFTHSIHPERTARLLLDN